MLRAYAWFAMVLEVFILVWRLGLKSGTEMLPVQEPKTTNKYEKSPSRALQVFKSLAE